MDDHTPKTLNRAGCRCLLGSGGKALRSDAEHQRKYRECTSSADGEQAQIEFIVLCEELRREVCQGFDADAVDKLLQRRGHLMHEADRFTMKHRLPWIGSAVVYRHQAIGALRRAVGNLDMWRQVRVAKELV